MKRHTIAMVAHELNRAYCASLGDQSQPAWAMATEAHQASMLAGVDMHLANPDATPEQAHEAWLENKRAEGWAYGEVKDVEAKKHPAFLPYDELLPEQKAKDYIFRAAVHVLKDLPDEAAPAPTPQVVSSIGGKVPVRYIGHRASYVDGLYGTRILFEKGKSALVPAEKAALMFTHPDVYEPGSLDEVPGGAPSADSAAQEADQAKKAAKERQEEEDQAMRDSVAAMDKGALAEFAKTNFQVDLDKRKSVADLRAQVTGLLDQFGAA